VTRDGLNKREITWLLAQEARSAAKALRQGIEIRAKESQPPPSVDAPTTEAPVLDSLTAIDDAMTLLGDLQTRKGTHRRGRIDVGALLYELSPEATINLDTADGTEIFGEEEGVRRMLQLLLSDSGGQTTSNTTGPVIGVKRDGESVKITAELGPDAAHHSALEHRWLNRMALRAGGRLDVSGRAQTLVLPADGAAQEKELAALRQELEMAQELGEAYARELAGVLTAAEEQVDSARGDTRESSWGGARGIALGTQFLLNERAQTGPDELLEALQLTAAAEANFEKRVPLSDAVKSGTATLPKIAQHKGHTLAVSETVPDRDASASLVPMIRWLVQEAGLLAQSGAVLDLSLEEQDGELGIALRLAPEPNLSEKWTRVAEGHDRELSHCRPFGPAGALLAAFAPEVSAKVGQSQLDEATIELWVRMKP